MPGNASENKGVAGATPAWYAAGLEHIWLPYAQMKTAPLPVPVAAIGGGNRDRKRRSLHLRIRQPNVFEAGGVPGRSCPRYTFVFAGVARHSALSWRARANGPRHRLEQIISRFCRLMLWQSPIVLA